jgi:3-hydroxyisobutyrate dehydrogenase
MKIGFIGLGNIGRAIARDLAVPGVRLLVHDVLPDGPAELEKLGATVAASPAAVARGADVVGVCVRDDHDVREVFEGPEGILSGAKPGLLVAIHSTLRIETVRHVAAAAAMCGVRVVDAPVSRGPGGPARRAVVFMVGGDSGDIERVRPYLELAALKIVIAGALGAGMALKLCNNALSYLTVICATDAINLARAAGLDVGMLADVTANNGVGSPTLTAILKRRVGDSLQFAPIPALDSLIGLGEKDLDCALEVGRDLNIDLPAVTLARATIRRAFEQNFG